MSTIKTTTAIHTYPDGSEVKEQEILVKNHWTYHDRLVLVVNGVEYILIATDLRKAIDNATR